MQIIVSSSRFVKLTAVTVNYSCSPYQPNTRTHQKERCDPSLAPHFLLCRVICGCCWLLRNIVGSSPLSPSSVCCGGVSVFWRFPLYPSISWCFVVQWPELCLSCSTSVWSARKVVYLTSSSASIAGWRDYISRESYWRGEGIKSISINGTVPITWAATPWIVITAHLMSLWSSAAAAAAALG